MRAALVVLLLLSACTFEVQQPLPPSSTLPTDAPSEVVALAGADLVVVEGARVVLNGSGSRALTGAATLSWSQREGPPVVLSNPSSPTPAFRAPLGPSSDGEVVRLVFQLQARVDDKADVDAVVVEVVNEVPDFVPRLGQAPGDVVVVDGAEASVTFRWPDTAPPAVTARCPIRGALDVRPGFGNVTVRLTPAVVPCAVVVDDGDANDDVGVGRAAVTLQPVGTLLPSPTDLNTPGVVRPGVVVDLAADLAAGVVVAAADGADLEFVDGGFVAPLSPGRLTLVAERRQNGVSGGVVVVPVDVSVAGKSAPVALGGGDLEVQPGARFRIAADSRDADGDPVTLTIEQVLGPPAARVGGFVDVMTAPEARGRVTLLFHVTAFDGLAASRPDPVRVVVDAAVQNRPPELSLPPTLFATPGAPFTIDAEAGARDDAGLITTWEIAQDEEDPVVVLAAPSTEPSLTLTARDAGDVYRFRVSAYDAGGLGVTVDVDVVVEDVGPYVDPARGSDDSGTGAADRPFATIAAALDTAARHRFPQLLLAGGEHALSGRLPDGLGLKGGHEFVDGVYVAGDAGDVVSVVTLGVDAFVVDGDVAAVSLAGDGVLHLEQDVHLDDVSGAAVAVAVDAGARVVARGAALGDVVVVDSAFACDDCALAGVHASDATVELLTGSATQIDVDAGLLLVGDDVTFDVAAVKGGANVAIGAASGNFLDVDDGVVSVTGAVIARGVVNDGVLRGVIGVGAEGLRGGGSADLEDSFVEGGVVADSVRFARVRVQGGLVAADAVVEACVVVAAGDGVAVDVDSGVLRQSTFIATGTVVDLGAVVSVENVVVKGAAAGAVPAAARYVGFVVDEGAVDCEGCVVGDEDDVDADGHLGAGDNAFVDKGLAVGIEFDIDGDVFGDVPDLGADERVE